MSEPFRDKTFLLEKRVDYLIASINSRLEEAQALVEDLEKDPEYDHHES